MALIEQTLTPVLLVLSLLGVVITLCSKNWIEGYYGDVMVTLLSPWYLCDVNCLECQSRKPLRHCFWMEDWTNTGFDSLSFVQHLEYWTLGGLAMALCLSLAARLGAGCRWKCGENCPIATRRSCILLLLVCCFLTAVTLALVGAKIHSDSVKISSFSDLELCFGWPFYFRCVAALFTGLATLATISLECRIRVNTQNEYDDRILVVTSSELVDDCISDEEEEEGVVL